MGGSKLHCTLLKFSSTIQQAVRFFEYLQVHVQPAKVSASEGILSSKDLQVLKAEDFLLSAVIPAQQGQEVEHGLGQEALLAELPQAGGPMPLAQLALVWSQDEAHMAELRLSPPQGLVYHDLQHHTISAC